MLPELAVAQHLPQGRSQAGDRHLNFHETRDNLPAPATSGQRFHIGPAVRLLGEAVDESDQRWRPGGRSPTR